MEPASPARLYAAVAGVLLLVLGIVGFFYDASFTGLGNLDPALGALEVNAWFNLLYVATGAIGLLLAGAASRPYSLAVGLLFTLLGILGLGTGWFHLLVGLLGLAAVAGTPRSRPSNRAKNVRQGPRNSEPRAKPTRQRA
ncbi:MAG TPA: DUF4383 domain-containing protein [Solirubrobacterales bacterium]|nr:DUF4383 domain-containing protein [Solirubrobacterales bacterium]